MVLSSTVETEKGVSLLRKGLRFSVPVGSKAKVRKFVMVKAFAKPIQTEHAPAVKAGLTGREGGRDPTGSTCAFHTTMMTDDGSANSPWGLDSYMGNSRSGRWAGPIAPSQSVHQSTQTQASAANHNDDEQQYWAIIDSKCTGPFFC